MGKKMILEDVDYSSVAIQVINVTSNAKTSGGGRQYLTGAATNVEAYQYNASGLANMRIITLDVSEYVGKHLKFTASRVNRAADTSTGAVYWRCWASAINTSNPWTGTSSMNNAVTPISHIDGRTTEESGDITTYFEKIPEGAKYLILSNQMVTNPSPKFEIYP